MDEASRLARAAEMGFDTSKPYYHGTGARSFGQFDLDRSGAMAGSRGERGVFLTPVAKDADHYAYQGSVRAPRRGEKPHEIIGDLQGERGKPYPVVYDGASVIPTYVKPGNQKVIDQVPGWSRDGRNLYNSKQFANIIADATSGGYDTVLIKNVDEGRGLGPIDQLVALKPENIRSKFAKFDPKMGDSADLLSAGGTSGVTSINSQSGTRKPMSGLRLRGILGAGGVLVNDQGQEVY